MAEQNQQIYTLMHKDKEVGVLSINNSDSRLLACKIIEPFLAPFLGNTTTGNMQTWWSNRAVPGSRKLMEDIIRKSGCRDSLEYLAKNLALSITDTYWIRPLDYDLHWEDVSLHCQNKNVVSLLPYHNANSYDPNASLGGQMEKYWDLSGNNPILIKTASAHFGQQSMNELFASKVHELQNNEIEFANYELRTLPDHSIQSCCEAFTSENVEFVSAYEVIGSEKSTNDISMYDAFIKICSKHGLDEDQVQKFMDYQTLTDFIINNTDEHLNNFGILRDSNTGDFLSPAPIFDSGNSMFYLDDTRSKGYSRIEILEQEITGIHKNWDKMLGHVKNKDVVDIEKLPKADEVMDFYVENGLPESKAVMISESYKTKIQMVQEFQAGHKISLHKEKYKR